MKTLLTLLGLCIVALGTPGCVTPRSPSVASLGAGSDTANINANRGRADAQISSAQAAQYSRQRQQVSEEMALEQQKRDNTMSNIKGMVDIGGSVIHAVR